MAHYAKVENGIVTQVIVADQDFINSGAVGDSNNWIQTSYNTTKGIHELGGEPLRKNYAGFGYSYNEQLDAFIPPKLFDSWILDEVTGTWVAPTNPPEDGRHYIWDEDKLDWVINIVLPEEP